MSTKAFGFNVWLLAQCMNAIVIIYNHVLQGGDKIGIMILGSIIVTFFYSLPFLVCAWFMLKGLYLLKSEAHAKLWLWNTGIGVCILIPPVLLNISIPQVDISGFMTSSVLAWVAVIFTTYILDKQFYDAVENHDYENQNQ